MPLISNCLMLDPAVNAIFRGYRDACFKAMWPNSQPCDCTQYGTDSYLTLTPLRDAHEVQCSDESPTSAIRASCLNQQRVWDLELLVDDRRNGGLLLLRCPDAARPSLRRHPRRPIGSPPPASGAFRVVPPARRDGGSCTSATPRVSRWKDRRVHAPPPPASTEPRHSISLASSLPSGSRDLTDTSNLSVCATHSHLELAPPWLPRAVPP